MFGARGQIRHMFRRAKSWNWRRYGLWTAVVLVIAAGLYWTVQYFDLRTPTEFAFATGVEGGGYYAISQKYAQAMAEQGTTLELKPMAGSVAIMQALVNREVPVGFVQGGSTDGFDLTGLHSLGSVFYESLLVFYRNDSFDEPLTYLTELEGKQVGIGQVGSGTHVVALQLLDANGLNETNTVLHTLAGAESINRLQSGELDAIFLITAPSAPILDPLMRDSSVSLMSFRRADAYVRRFPYFSKLTLGEGAVDLRDNIPSEEKTLLGVRANLIANELLHTDSARQLLVAAINVHQQGDLFAAPGEFPNALYDQIPVPVPVRQFLEVGPTGIEKYLPVNIASIIERFLFVFLPVVLVLYPLLRNMPNAYTFTMQYRVFRWYQRVRRIESSVEHYELHEINEQIDKLEELDQQIASALGRMPIFFQRDVYNLRLHVKLVIDRLREQRARLRGETAHVAAQEADVEEIAIDEHEPEDNDAPRPA